MAGWKKLLTTGDTSDNLIYSGVTTVEDALDDYYNFRQLVNGTFKESFDCLTTVSGSTISATLEQAGGGDLTMQFSDGYTTLDCTPAQTVELTAGTTTAPQKNFIYVLQSNKTLTNSDSEWPATEHIKVAFIHVLDAEYTDDDGALINQNWNDHLYGTDNMGHLAHIAERSRRDGAYWHSGVDGAGDDDYITSDAGTVYFAANAGVLYQMHKHSYAAKDTDPAGGNDDIHVVNHDTTPYLGIHNLYDVVDDADGDTLTNKFFNIIFWGVANKGGEYSPVFANLPTGSYNNLSDAQGDVDGYDVYDIPHEFAQDSSTGFLICRITFKKTGGTWAYQSTVDLRGVKPTTVTGGGVGGAITDFADSQFTVFDGADNTRVITLSADSITTGNTRVITMADADVDLADIALKLNTADIDDTPVNAETAAPISSNWAYDHITDADVHHASKIEADDQAFDALLAAGNNDDVQGCLYILDQHNHDGAYYESGDSPVFTLVQTSLINSLGDFDIRASDTEEDTLVKIWNVYEPYTASLEVEGNVTASGLDILGDITVSGLVDGVDIAGHDADANAHHAEAHSIASHNDTSATGTELNTLTDGSDADALHVHSLALATASDVLITSVGDNEVLAYNTLGSNWINQTAAEAGLQPTITGAATTIDTEDLTASRALASSAGGKVEVSAVTATELGYLDGVTSAIQTQLGNKLNVADIDDTAVNGETAQPISSNWAFDHDADANAHHPQAHSMDSHSDFSEDSPAEAEVFSYDGTAEEWINRTLAEAGIQPTITGAATTIDTEDLTASRALASSAGGKVEVSLVTSTELGYLDGVTSSIQTQLDVRRPIPMPFGFAQRNTDTSDSGWDREGLNSTYPGYRGHIMPTSGSIVAISARIYYVSHSTDGTLTLKLTYGNGSSPPTAFELNFSLVAADVGYYQAEVTSADVGTHEFVAGDVIALYAYFEDGLVGSYRQGDATMHVVYDDEWFVS
jgi:hypothetical protein